MYSEPVTKFIKAAKMGYVIISVVFCILGVFILMKPEFSMAALCHILGVVMIAFGVIKLIGYFSRDLYRLAFQYDLAFGILLLVLGIVMILYYRGVISFFNTVFGILVLADGLFKIQLSLDAKVFGIRKWWLILILAIAAGILGTLLVIRPVKSGVFLMKLSGMAFLFEGALSMCVVLCAVKVTKAGTER